MTKRLISAAIGVAILLFVLIWSNVYFIEAWMAAIALVSLYEMFKVTGMIKFKPLVVVSAISAVAMLYFQFKGIDAYFELIALFIVALFVILVVSGGKTVKVEHAAMAFIFSLVLPLFFSQVTRVRFLEHGSALIYLIFLAAFITDSAAFFVGRSLGKHKLAPAVSPKKTVEGAIGGVIAGIISFVVFGIIMKFGFDCQVNFVLLIVFGIAASVISEIGDLSMSVIKRQFGVKDFGNIMPGHGGALDRFDSILFVAPVLSLLFHHFPVIM